MYTELLGKLLSNIWSLETILRYFICIRLNEPIPNIYDMEIDTEVEDGHFTNFKTLGQLIDKYNSLCISDSQKVNKEKILSIRDLLGHGRIHITNMTDTDNWYLVKFSDPKKDKNNKAKLTNKVSPNRDSGLWIKESIKFIYSEIQKVGKYGDFKDIKTKKD